jgi:hypothetical protein
MLAALRRRHGRIAPSGYEVMGLGSATTATAFGAGMRTSGQRSSRGISQRSEVIRVWKEALTAFQGRGPCRPSEKPAGPVKVVRFLSKLKGKHVPVPGDGFGD